MSEFPFTPEEERQLRAALDRLARMRIPEERDLWPALQARLSVPSRRGWRGAIQGQWVWMAAGLLLALALIGMASISSLWEAFFLTRPLERNRRLQPLSLTQTQEGVTVTIERAYADANRILIGYRVRGLPESADVRWLPILTLEDASGRPIPGLIGEGLAGASEILGLSLPPGELAGVVGFDPWALPDWPARRPASLSLRLHVALQADAALAPPAPTPMAGWRFVFDLTVPVEPEAVLYGPHTEAAHGLALTLERWVWAPSGARARVCFVPPDPGWSWIMRAELAVEGKEEISPTAPSGEVGGGKALTLTAPVLLGPPLQQGERVCLDQLFAASAGGRARPAELRILELLSPASEPVRRWPGPWVFRIP